LVPDFRVSQGITTFVELAGQPPLLQYVYRLTSRFPKQAQANGVLSWIMEIQKELITGLPFFLLRLAMMIAVLNQIQ
jgi:hypothetical protein